MVGPLRAFSAGDAVHSAVSCTRGTQPQMPRHRYGSIEMMAGRRLFNTRGHFKAVESDMSSSKCDKYLVTSFSFMTPVFFFFLTLSCSVYVSLDLSFDTQINEIGRHKPAK